MNSFCLCEIGRFIHLNIHRNRRMRLGVLSLLPTASAFLLSGCTLLPMKNLQPVIAPPISEHNVICKGSETFLTGEVPISGPVQSVLQYILPSDPDPNTHQPMVAKAKNFEDYRTMVRVRVASKLPVELAQDRVTVAFVEFLTSASGEAQLDDQIADSNLDRTNETDKSTISKERTSILKYSSAPKLKHGELKDFAR